jgi:putative ABC transport system permease protein
MNTLKYIWRNIRRNPVRSLLTILSVGFSLALMTVLYGFLASQETWKNGAAQANRIVVMNIQGFSGKLPISSVDDVRSTKFVEAAVPFAWYGGSYQDEQMPFAQFAFRFGPNTPFRQSRLKPSKTIDKAACWIAELPNAAAGRLVTAYH